MTALEMQIFFQDIVETNSEDYPKRWLPATDIIFEYISEAERKFFNERYLSGSFVERTQIINGSLNELQPLIEREVIFSNVIEQYHNYTNSYFVVKDNTKEFVSGVLLHYSNSALGTGSAKIPLKPVEGDLTRYVTTQVNIPIIMKPVVFLDTNVANEDNSFNGSRLVILTDAYTDIGTGGSLVDVGIFLFLNHPSGIHLSEDGSGDSKLPARFHELIVRAAAGQMLQDRFNLSLAKAEKERQEKDRRE